MTTDEFQLPKPTAEGQVYFHEGVGYVVQLIGPSKTPAWILMSAVTR